MRPILVTLLAILIFQSCKRTKTDYLIENRFDLNASNFDFPQKDFKIIGFGAYHGSAKTEDVELEILNALTKQNAIKYYLPETDFSIAHYFNEYLKTGDTLLLKDLVMYYGIRVPQERTIEVYEKWREFKKINDGLPNADKLEVVGIDKIVNYKYPSKHIVELVNDTDKPLGYVQDIRDMLSVDTTSYALGNLSYAYKKLKNLVDDYEKDKRPYEAKITNVKAFNHLVNNLKTTFQKKRSEREKIIYDNYLALSEIYNFKIKPQFLRMGFSHITKSREGRDGYPYFFTRLIENNIYPKEDVISVIGYLTNSEVVWDELYDKEGNYIGYTKEAGFGIGDYEKEYFKGIQNLKDAKLSDKTLYRLNRENTPYADHQPDLIEVIMTDEASNGEALKGMSTTDFLDYAILISGSEASTPIYEMK